LIIVGDMREALRALPADSVHAIVTDPPYGLSFMGKGWDGQVPGPDYWREALRVAKPGAHLLAFGGTRTAHRLACAIEDAGWELRDCLSWLYGSGFPKSHNLPGGWGTALKPAWEPIYLARRPFKGTVAANVLEHGCGALNVDGCRVGFASEQDRQTALPGSMNRGHVSAAGFVTQDRSAQTPADRQSPLGRWPANLVLDEDAAAMLDGQTADKLHGAGQARNGSTSPRPKVYEESSYNVPCSTGDMHRFGDSGGASRFFYTAKASRSEREAGLGNSAERQNTHPTVKPIALMRWLVRLVTPRGGVVLDPFMGSGTTGIAAVLEGMDFIGVELNPAYAEIARARIAHNLTQAA